MAEIDRGVLVQSYRAYAARYVLNSLYNCKLDSKEKVEAMMPALRKRWRWFLARLTEAKYKHSQDDRQRSYMANCPPVGIVPPADDGSEGRRLTRCRRAMVCPFCYARDYALNAYDRLVPAVAWQKKNTRTLYASTYETEIDVAETGYLDAVRRVETLVNGPARRIEVDAFKTLGAVVFHRVRMRLGETDFAEPVVTKLIVVRAALVVCKPGARMPILPGAAIERIDDPRKKDLATQIGKLFSYPAEWYDAPPVMVRAVVTKLAKARAFAAYGTCRNAGPKEPKTVVRPETTEN